MKEIEDLIFKFKNVDVLIASTFTGYVFRVGHEAQWNQILLELNYIPVDYTNASINYHLAYQVGHGGQWIDKSFMIYSNNRPVALWPLSISIKNNELSLSSHGMPLMPPRFVSSCSAITIKRITKKCLDLAESIGNAFDLTEWRSGTSSSGSIQLTEWHAEALKRDSICTVEHDLYLDLRPDIADIKKNFRKSYKSLISSGLKLWTIHTLDSHDEIIWNEFRNLHLKVSGRKTRSDETWLLQLDDIKNKVSFLIYLRNKLGQMIGGGVFTYTRDEGFYSVAAYDRSLFDKPIGHIVQFKAIEALKEKGVTWYKIGRRFFNSDLPRPTEKEITISEFKEGFASHLTPHFLFKHKLWSIDESMNQLLCV